VRILAINGSPRGLNGNTARLTEPLLVAARQAGATVECLYLADLDVQPCRACDGCHRTGTCGIRDDTHRVHAAMTAADGIVLASPNYIFHVTAQLKCLLDRCSCFLHLQSLEPYGVAVVTSGGSGAAEVEAYLLRFLRALGGWTVGSIGCEAWMLDEEFHRPDLHARAADLGTRLVEAIRTRVTFPDQVEERRAFRDRMRQLIELQRERWPYEHEQWQARREPGGP
jgi:multimeric flavodoxin WrbA